MTSNRHYINIQNKLKNVKRFVDHHPQTTFSRNTSYMFASPGAPVDDDLWSYPELRPSVVNPAKTFCAPRTTVRISKPVLNATTVRIPSTYHLKLIKSELDSDNNLDS